MHIHIHTHTRKHTHTYSLSDTHTAIKTFSPEWELRSRGTEREEGGGVVIETFTDKDNGEPQKCRHTLTHALTRTHTHTHTRTHSHAI